MSGFVTSTRYTWLGHCRYSVKRTIINRLSIPIASYCTSYAQSIQHITSNISTGHHFRGCCTYPTTVRSRGTWVGWNLQILFSLVMQLIFPFINSLLKYIEYVKVQIKKKPKPKKKIYIKKQKKYFNWF